MPALLSRSDIHRLSDKEAVSTLALCRRSLKKLQAEVGAQEADEQRDFVDGKVALKEVLLKRRRERRGR